MWSSKMRLLACCYSDPEMRIDPDTVYPIRPDCRDDAPKTRFKPRVGISSLPIIFLLFSVLLFYFLLSPFRVYELMRSDF
jgi:hypothetical protein